MYNSENVTFVCFVRRYFHLDFSQPPLSRAGVHCSDELRLDKQ